MTLPFPGKRDLATMIHCGFPALFASVQGISCSKSLQEASFCFGLHQF